MKRFSFLALTVAISTFSVAEEPVSSNTVHASATNVLITETATPSGKRYIKDYMLIPLRSGDTQGHKIVHKGIKSGTPLTLLKVNESGQYSLVKTAEGLEGWLPSQYLMEEIPATVKLAEAEDTINKLSANVGPNALNVVDLQKKNEALLKNMQALEETNNALGKELEHIKSLSSDVVKLHEDNKKLVIGYEAAKRQQDTVFAENESLKNQLSQNTFINGAIAVILGILATLIIQHLTKSNKRYSDWA